MVVLSDLPPPTEGVEFVARNTEAVISKSSVGKGTVFVAESRVSWLNEETGKGFSLEYPHISVHAISRDLQNFPAELLYLQLDINLNEPEAGESSDASETSGTGDDPYTEVYFVPEDKSLLDEMYKAMSHCQSLHPDPDQSDSGTGGGRPPVFGSIAPGRFIWNLGPVDEEDSAGGLAEEADEVDENDAVGYLDDENGDENGHHEEEGGGDGCGGPEPMQE